MESCVIYSRVSTELQDNSTAIESLERYASSNGYEVVKIFSDVISGRTMAEERNEFSQLIDFIDDNKVNHLLLWELSRLGRNLSNILFVINMLSNKGVNVYLAKDKLNTLDMDGKVNSHGRFMISILGTMAELELETFKERSKRGIRANVQRGGAGTGVIKPYGFDNIDKKLVVNEREMEVVKKIYDLFEQGLGTQQIANYLNSLGIPTKFNTIFNKNIKTKYGLIKNSKDFVWRTGTIYGILTNTIYKGARRYKGEVFEMPPIIDKDRFDAIGKTLKDKSNLKGINRKYVNVVKGKLKCGYCNHSYYMHKRASGKDNSYKCIKVRYLEQNECGNAGIGIDKLNNCLYVVMNSYVSMKYDVNEEKIGVLNTEIENLNIGLKNTDDALKFEYKKLNNLYDLRIEEKISSKDYNLKYDEIQLNIKKFEKQYIGITKSLENNTGLINKLRNLQFSDIVHDPELFKKYVNEVIESMTI